MKAYSEDIETGEIAEHQGPCWEIIADRSGLPETEIFTEYRHGSTRVHNYYAQIESELLPQIERAIRYAVTCLREWEDEIDELELTIATDRCMSTLGFQTGDNSFQGNCYGLPYWATTTITRERLLSDSPCFDAVQLLNELFEIIEQEQYGD